jgi:hypothetical protein
VIAIVLFFVLLKILKNVFKAVVITLLICIAILGIIGFIIYFDSAKLNKAIAGDKTLLMLKDNKVVAGVRINNLNKQNDILTNGVFTSHDEEKLKYYEEKINDAKYEEKDNLILIFNQNSFSGAENLVIGEKSIKITKEKLSRTLDAKTVDQIFEALLEGENFTSAEKQQAKNAVTSKFNTPQELKNTIFINVFMEDLKAEGISFIVRNANNNSLQTKPEFLTIKLLKYLPNRALEKMISKE